MKEGQLTFNGIPDESVQKITIEQMRSIWDEVGHIHKDEELYQIRDWIYRMTEIINEVIEEERNNGTLPGSLKCNEKA